MLNDLRRRQQHAVAAYLARREGFDYDTLQAGPPSAGDPPAKDDFDLSAFEVMRGLHYAGITPAELVEALTGIDDTPEKPGYHLTPIAKGVLGEPSKIIEEAAEFADAVQQGATIMGLVELADLQGAIRAYLARFNLTLADLDAMADITERAFVNGRR